MSQNVTRQQSSITRREPDGVARIASQLERLKTQLAAALPKHLTPDRVSRVFLTTLRQSPALQRCSVQSLFGALMTASQLGLEVGSGLGLAYLIPFQDECTLIVGYRGLIELARRSGQISTIYATEVRKGDKFKYTLGTDPRIEHEPGEERDMSDAGIIYTYAVAKLKDGSTQFEVMSKEEVDEIRRRSRAAKSGPWVSDYAQMSRKTVLRRLCKMLPASIEMQTAITLDEAADANIAQSFVDVAIDDVQETPHDAVTGEVIEREPGQEG